MITLLFMKMLLNTHTHNLCAQINECQYRAHRQRTRIQFSFVLEQTIKHIFMPECFVEYPHNIRVNQKTKETKKNYSLLLT